MARRKKTWAEKMEEPRVHQVKRISKDLAGMKSGQMILIATPKIVDAYIRNIPAGGSSNLPQMRADLADKYGAETTCPLTTGIFVRIVAEAANEAHENGAALSEITPVWRMFDETSQTIKKLSFDPAYMLQQRDHEHGPASAGAN
jgi:hypothetical protein